MCGYNCRMLDGTVGTASRKENKCRDGSCASTHTGLRKNLKPTILPLTFAASTVEPKKRLEAIVTTPRNPARIRELPRLNDTESFDGWTARDRPKRFLMSTRDRTRVATGKEVSATPFTLTE